MSSSTSRYQVSDCQPSTSRGVSSSKTFHSFEYSVRSAKCKPPRKPNPVPKPIVKQESSSDEESEEPLDPELLCLKDFAETIINDLEDKITEQEFEAGKQRFEKMLQFTLSSKPVQPLKIEMMEMLDTIYHPWKQSVAMSRNQKGEPVAEMDYIPRSFVCTETVETACGNAFVTPTVSRFPTTMAYSSLTRNEFSDEEKFPALASMDHDDSNFQDEYAKQMDTVHMSVETRRYHTLLLTEGRIVLIVAPVFEEHKKQLGGNWNPADPIPEKVFEAVSQALRGSEGAAGIMNRYYDAIGQPVESYLPNLNSLTVKVPTVAKFVDSFHRLLCNRCFRCYCPEHPYKPARIPKIYPMSTPKVASNPCGSHCHKSTTVVPHHKPVTAGDKVVLKTFCSESDGVVKYTYCELSKMLGNACVVVFNAVQELLRSPDPVVDDGSKKNGNGNNRRKRKANQPGRRTAPSELKRVQDIKTSGKVTQYQYKPCSHSGNGTNLCRKGDVCGCVDRITLCERYCDCGGKCVNRNKGCNCIGDCRTERCPCYVSRRECDPEICKCAAKTGRPNCCANTVILFNTKKIVKCGPSDVHGLGAFIMEDCKAGEFISEYTGEVISQEEADRRGQLYDHIRLSYLFTLNREMVVDALRKGNKIRYANHSKLSPNCRPEVFRVQGEHRIGIFAKRDLAVGEELFFDYDYNQEAQKLVEIEVSKKANKAEYRAERIAENVGARSKKPNHKSTQKIKKSSGIVFRERQIESLADYETVKPMRFIDGATITDLAGINPELNAQLLKDFSVVKPFELIAEGVFPDGGGCGDDSDGWFLDGVKDEYYETFPEISKVVNPKNIKAKYGAWMDLLCDAMKAVEAQLESQNKEEDDDVIIVEHVVASGPRAKRQSAKRSVTSEPKASSPKTKKKR